MTLTSHGTARGPATGRLDLDPDRVGRDLVSLVLTVVELLRQLMERQALRRCDHDDLTDEQVERIGTTLMLLDQRMDELCAEHGLTRDELNLDLGPLGTLLAR
ncbi:gas vesicle protein K [Streptomyces sp. NBC_01808]|uniref:gas vesicle protein K n=1 Tax=Streptomyces sp. NBC_01808 TaxID=2975947 RepID=UPI002DDB3888|nr:gas vesicle protein K [Streptomyces sp. NBC_01808]WSA42086.1 gas vesicle protein K [Streptomyces sp. NBC_01808]